MASSLVKILIHLVFSTGQRIPFIEPDLKARLYPYMAGILRSEEATLIALGGMPDHVHVLLRLKADRKLSYLVRDLKSGSSKWVHEKSQPVPEFAWQTGYAAFSVSQSQEAKVKAYILNQEVHHRRISFEEELLDLLERHQVEFDPAHLFD